jgi:hypothetical protein
MGVKKAGREELSESAQKWLPGEPSGFFKFKTADELASMWAQYGDPEVAEMGRIRRARKARDRSVITQAAIEAEFRSPPELVDLSPMV